MKKNKKLLTAAAAVMAVALLLGGTYAWTDYSQHKSNEFSTGEKYLYDVTLIDDFVEVKNWQEGERVTSGIRVQNMDTASGKVYVRLVLKEYLEFGDLEEVFSDVRYMIDLDGEFLRSNEAASSAALGDIRARWPDDRYQNIQETDLVQDSGYSDDGENYWYVKTKGGDPNGQYGKFLLRTSEYDTQSLVDGVVRSDHAYDEEWHQKYPNGECEYTTRIWPENLADLNLTDAHGFTSYIAWQLGNDVEIINEWDDFSGKAAKWYLEKSTGCAYWGKALEPGDVTSNLLETVELTNRPNADYFYYNVHADMTAVSDPDDISMQRSEVPELNMVMRGDMQVYGAGVPDATVYLTYRRDLPDEEGNYHQTYEEVVERNVAAVVQGNSYFGAAFSQRFMPTKAGTEIIEAYQIEPGKLPSETVVTPVLLPH